MSSNQRFGIVIVALLVVGIALMRFAPAQQVPVSGVGPNMGGQVVDVTPPAQISPRLHVVYDFNRQNAVLIQINTSRPSIKVLDRVSLNPALP